MIKMMHSLSAAAFVFCGAVTPVAAFTDAVNGDWSQQQVTLSNTSEAALMVRVGDINNFGFDWSGVNPFSGNSTPVHDYPWTAPLAALLGLDRIMVVTSYRGHAPAGEDGYTSTTTRPTNQVQDITLSYDLGGLSVQSAILQIFVDDFQAPVWKANYQVTINGARASFLESAINFLNQTGPIGKLITVQIPSDFLAHVASGSLAIRIDDTTTGAGDGYAIDFVKLLVNPLGVSHTGTVNGRVTDAAGRPLANVTISAAGISSATTDSNGVYTMGNVPAGLALLTASLTGYELARSNLDVIEGKSQTADFSLRASTSLTTTPVCTLSANPPTITAGSSATLTATCSPSATSYSWTGGTCAGNTQATCTVTPSAATTYTVTGTNTDGNGNMASAVVRISGSGSFTVPGTLEDDFFLPSGNNSYYGGAGNDTYIISPYTLRSAVTAKIIDTEGTNVIQLVNGMTIASSSFFNNAVQFMLSNGAIVQVLGASSFIYQLGVNASAGEVASNLNFSQFAAALGASIPAAGAAAVSGSANFVVSPR